MDFTRKTNFFKGCSWFKFNNLELAQGMALKIYTSIVKCLKLKARKFWGLIPTFVGVTAEKLIGRPFCRGTQYVQNLHKGEIYLIGENFVGENFSLGKIFVT